MKLIKEKYSIFMFHVFHPYSIEFGFGLGAFFGGFFLVNSNINLKFEGEHRGLTLYISVLHIFIEFNFQKFYPELHDKPFNNENHSN